MAKMSKEQHDSDMKMLKELGEKIQSHPVNVAIARAIEKGPTRNLVNNSIERIGRQQEARGAEIFHPVVKFLDTALEALGLVDKERQDIGGGTNMHAVYATVV